MAQGDHKTSLYISVALGKTALTWMRLKPCFIIISVPCLSEERDDLAEKRKELLPGHPLGSDYSQKRNRNLLMYKIDHSHSFTSIKT